MSAIRNFSNKPLTFSTLQVIVASIVAIALPLIGFGATIGTAKSSFAGVIKRLESVETDAKADQAEMRGSKIELSALRTEVTANERGDVEWRKSVDHRLGTLEASSIRIEALVRELLLRSPR